jgi:S1-C subfamily serine protease
VIRFTLATALALALVSAAAPDTAAAPVPRGAALPPVDPQGDAKFGVELDTDWDIDPNTQARTARGQVIATLFPGGAAWNDGLRLGDVIVKVGDAPVAYLHELRGELRMFRPGAVVPVTVDRGGKTVVVRVRLLDTLGDQGNRFSIHPQEVVIPEPMP